MSKQELDEYGDVLDAYGHLLWTVSMRPNKDGGDWMACFDARRVPDGIEYHVVVNSDSGGFIDTLEHGTVSIKDASRLLSLPEYWWEIGLGNGPMYSPKKCVRSWRKHILGLITEPAPEADWSFNDTPQQMGWVDSQGRP